MQRRASCLVVALLLAGVALGADQAASKCYELQLPESDGPLARLIIDVERRNIRAIYRGAPRTPFEIYGDCKVDRSSGKLDCIGLCNTGWLKATPDQRGQLTVRARVLLWPQLDSVLGPTPSEASGGVRLKGSFTLLPTTEAVCVTAFERALIDDIALRRGDVGPRVGAMAAALLKLGFYAESPAGYFTRAMEEAVINFQRFVGVPATGVADRQTLDLLRQASVLQTGC